MPLSFVENRWLMILLFFLAATVAGSAAARAQDCGTAGKALFEDRFTDATGGWEDDPSATFGKPALTLNLGAAEAGWTYLNKGFDAGDADYCVAAVLPPAIAADNATAIGLAILYANEDNYVSFVVYSDGVIQLSRKANGSWDDLLNQGNPAVQPAVGSVVVLHITIKEGLLTAVVNGVEVKKTRVKLPTGSLKFGVIARTDKPAGRVVPFEFKQIRVTAVP